MEKRVLEVKHTKNISYLEAMKLVGNSVVTTTYANEQLDSDSRNDPLQEDKSNKRTEHTNRITKRKLD